MPRSIITLVTLPVLLGALAACGTVPSGDPPSLFDDLSFHDYFVTGRYLAAEQAGERRIRSDADRNARNLAPLCYVYFKLRRYDKLLACVENLQARVLAGDHIHSQKTLLGIFAEAKVDITPLPHLMKAGAYLDLGDPARSLEEGRLGLAKVKEGDEFHDYFSATQFRLELLTVMGLAAVQVGQSDEAERLLKALSETRVSLLKYQIRGNLKDLGLAQLNVALGHYEKALEFLARERAAIIRVFVDLGAFGESFATLYALSKGLMIGKSYLELGRIAEARDALDSVIMHKRAPEQGDIYWIALYERGRVAEREGKPEDAIDYYRRAIEVIERQRASLATEATKIGFVGNKQRVYGRLVALLVAAGRVAEAFETVERSKARALVDMLAEKTDFSVRGVDPEKARRMLAELDRADTESRAMVATGQSPIDGYIRSIRAVQAEIQSTAPEFASLVTVSAVALDKVRALLGAEEALVEYYRDSDDLFAFVVTATDLRAIRLDGRNLEADVRNFREALMDVGSPAHLEVSKRLYGRLVASIEGLLTKPNLLIVAHGVLHYLPFNALHDGNRYLIERYSLRLLPAASVLQYLRRGAPGKPAGMLAFGNPDLGDPRLDLRHAQAEAVAVSGTIPKSRALVRGEATETALKRFGQGFAYIHIASHGEFDPDQPLKSALRLAKDAENDGALTIGELYSLRLDADLVTLSACETGLGKVSNGDDVVGLTRGFLYAGSGSVVASLWKVDDLATADLMTRFYAHLARGDRRQALRAAQLETRSKYPHPFYWAAFQLTGNAR